MSAEVALAAARRAEEEDLDARSCPICFEAYDARRRRPVVPVPAGCGHRLCALCASDMLRWKFQECPQCRREFKTFKAVSL